MVSPSLRKEILGVSRIGPEANATATVSLPVSCAAQSRLFCSKTVCRISRLLRASLVQAKRSFHGTVLVSQLVQ